MKDATNRMQVMARRLETEGSLSYLWIIQPPLYHCK